MNAGQKITPKKLGHAWTLEKLTAKDRKSVELIRERALQHGASDLVAMCDHVLGSMPLTNATARRPKSTASNRSSSDVVIGYHFVCGKERGVITADAGQFWSGSWVVAQANAQKSVEHGAYLALHESKNEQSYKQGKVIDFRRAARDMVSKDETGSVPQIYEGIEFLVQETTLPYEWVGNGAGEKGYLWASDVVTATGLSSKSIGRDN